MRVTLIPHLRAIRTIALVALFGAVFLASPAQAQPRTVEAVIDAGETHAPISPYVYGQFLEHAGHIVNDILWAELLDDRKFFFPVVKTVPEEEASSSRMRRAPLKRWLAIGNPDNIVMDSHRPFVGRQSPKILLLGNTPTGFRQEGLALKADMAYIGRIALKADDDAQVDVSLVWGSGANDRQTVSIDMLAAEYVTYPLAFVSAGGTTDARFEITATGNGSVHVGVVSLMPADNIGGFRPEVVAELKKLRSGVYRFPGGNFVSSHEWRDAIGDPDRRPPVYDPVWEVVQPNDVGTDEFIRLSRLAGVEPYITVNAGFGDQQSAADMVEYTNGSVRTKMGQLRAANGHPEPYNVKFWGIGNEAWGSHQMGAMALEQFVLKNNMFAEAMRGIDSTIVLIGSGAMPDAMTGAGESLLRTGQVIPEPLGPADWTGGLFLHSLDHMDMISEHYYNFGGTRYDVTVGEQVPVDADEPLVQWMRRAANHVRMKVEAYQDYEELIPALRENPVPIIIAEWAYVGGPIQPNSYRAVPATAWKFHEMFRHSDLFFMGNYTFGTSLVSSNATEATLNPNGLLFKFYRDHFGTIPVTVTGNSPQPDQHYAVGGEEPRILAGSPTFPLDVVAAWTDDRQALTVAVVNPTEDVQTLSLQFDGANLSGSGTLWRMDPGNLDAQNIVGQQPQVVVEEEAVQSVPANTTFAPYSVTIYRLDAR